MTPVLFVDIPKIGFIDLLKISQVSLVQSNGHYYIHAGSSVIKVDNHKVPRDEFLKIVEEYVNKQLC